MRKKLILRCLIGAPIGLAISTIITIIISLSVGDGNFYPVVPQLVTDCGNEINAVLLQAGFSLLYGAVWAGALIIWEKENWSILRQTIIHLIVCSLGTFPIAYLMRWMEHTIFGILIYIGIFFLIYLVIWLSLYSSIKKHIQQINDKVQQNNSAHS